MELRLDEEFELKNVTFSKIISFLLLSFSDEKDMSFKTIVMFLMELYISDKFDENIFDFSECFLNDSNISMDSLFNRFIVLLIFTSVC